MASSWHPHGILMASSWHPHGILMAFSWHYHGNLMEITSIIRTSGPVLFFFNYAEYEENNVLTLKGVSNVLLASLVEVEETQYLPLLGFKLWG